MFFQIGKVFVIDVAILRKILERASSQSDKETILEVIVAVMSDGI